METMGLGAGSYPTPREEDTEVLKGKICVTYTFETEVPSEWNYEDIIDDIKNNLSEYTYDAEISIDDIDI